MDENPYQPPKAKPLASRTRTRPSLNVSLVLVAVVLLGFVLLAALLTPVRTQGGRGAAPTTVPTKVGGD